MSKDMKKKKTVESQTNDSKPEENAAATDTQPDIKEQSAEPSPEEKLADELKKSQEQYLRLAAEYDNFRKRSTREKENAFVDAKVTVFTELLPVLDNFERALSSEQSSLEDFKKGVEMTYQQFTATCQKFGIESFGNANDKFDPNFHNAVMHVEDGNLSDNTIVEVFQKGYKVGERVLRPAMVKVAN